MRKVRTLALISLLLLSCNRIPAASRVLSSQPQTSEYERRRASSSVTQRNFGLASLKSYLPLSYVQGAFTAGTGWSWVNFQIGSYEERISQIKFLAKNFNGGEVVLNDMRTPKALQDIRLMSNALRDASAQLSKPFFGYYLITRPLGFHYDEEIASQPADYRSQSLRTDGSLLTRLPNPDEWGSMSGCNFDITNQRAVSQFISNMRRIFRSDCASPGECTGPLYGFLTFAETKLTGCYSALPEQNMPAYLQEMAPVHWEQADPRLRFEKLRYGHLWDLLRDGDPYYASFSPPKRSTPLFSESAASSFAAYAAAHGHPEYTLLPADRGEFNDNDALVSLPQWVQFVPLEDTAYWELWENWVYDTWGDFMDSYAKAVADAQGNNPGYQGALLFQFPIWYSVRGKAAADPVTYTYKNLDGGVNSETVRLSDYKYYKGLNPVAMGIDVERVAKSPYYAGILHETTSSLPPLENFDWRDESITMTETFRQSFLAKGVAVKKLMHDNGKIFGAFARTQDYRTADPITPEAFRKSSWESVLSLLLPDMVSALPLDWFYSDQEGVGFTPGVAPEMSYGEIWRQEMKLLETLLFHPRTRSAHH